MGLMSVVRRWFSSSARQGRGELADFWYMPAGAAGKEVNPWTSLGVSAYWACLCNISEDMAKLPLPVYRATGPNEREKLTEHPLSYTLNETFNPDMTAFVGRQTLNQWALGWGNGYAEIQRNGIGRPVALWPIHPSRVVPKRDAMRQLYYEVKIDGGGIVDLAARDVFHLVGRLSEDGITGISIAQSGSASISRGMAIQDYGTSLFNGGMSDRVAIRHPGRLQGDAPQKIRESWVSLYGGASGLDRGPAILQEGMEVVRIGIPPKDAQMIDEAQFTPEDIARLFRCPLSKIGHFLRAQGWSTLETLNTDYVVDTLLPWDAKWTQEASRKLFTLTEGNLYIGHNFNALMKGDSAARGTWYDRMLRLGIFSRNDIRALEDMNPVPGGDAYYIDSANLREITAGDSDADDVNFKREVVKALIADGTIGDVIFNLTEGKKLLEEVNIPVTKETAEPWLPVIASAGQPVTGEVLEDAEGDIVGGDIEEPAVEANPNAETPNEEPGPAPAPAADDDKAADDGKAAPGVGVGDNLAALRAAAARAMDHAFGRIARKELKALKKAIRDTLDKGDRQGFETWTTGFYGDMIQELRLELGPANEVMDSISGSSSPVTFTTRCEAHAQGSRQRLMAALSASGSKGVKAQLSEWEKQREFSNAG